ncbi:MAG: superoxide dismutase family protein [Terriglobia bacterium]
MKKPAGTLVVAFLYAGALWGQTAPRSAKAIIYNRKGQQIGVAKFAEVQGAGVRISLEVSRLPPGTHGIHIHSAGKCVPPDFASAGPHFNPGHRQHGLRNPNGPHAGDLGNLIAGASGKAQVVLLDPVYPLKRATPTRCFGPQGLRWSFTQSATMKQPILQAIPGRGSAVGLLNRTA